MAEKKYTLDEARRLLAAEYCTRNGHNFEETWADGQIIAMYCTSPCGTVLVPRAYYNKLLETLRAQVVALGGTPVGS